MAKPLPLLIGVLGVGATATGGYMLMQKGGDKAGTEAGSASATNVDNQGTVQTSNDNGQGATPPGSSDVGESASRTGNNGAQGGSSPTATLTFENVEAFKSNAADSSECLKDYFSGIDLTPGTGARDIDENSKADAGKIFKTEGAESTFTPYKSCLFINWKKSVADNKWSGKFTWLWTFVRGDEGFINFNVMEPSTTEGKVKFTGLFYLVQKSTTPDKWEVKFKKEVSGNSKEVAKSDVGSYFPKVSEDFKTTSKLQNTNWDYANDLGKLDEICKENDACKTTPEVKKFRWNADTKTTPDAASKALKEWSADLTWWDKIYGVNDKWNLGEKTKDFKGKWEAVQAQ